MSLRYLGTDGRNVTYRGRASTFITQGRAPATPFIQHLLTIFNSSTVERVAVNRIVLDAYSTGNRIMTTPPSVARVGRVGTAPTNGTVLTKAPLDSGLTSESTLDIRGDASADRTNSATALAATLLANQTLTQEVMPRNIWVSGSAPAAGTYTELADRVEFFTGDTDVILRQNEGISLYLIGAAATSIPNTDWFVASIDWEEYLI